jgi:hypothetical protein
MQANAGDSARMQSAPSDQSATRSRPPGAQGAAPAPLPVVGKARRCLRDGSGSA